MLNMMICKQHEQEHKRFRFCKERFIVMSVSEKQIMCRFPDRESGFFNSAPWCNGNTSDSDSGITGSNPVGTAPGCSYNGYYSRLLICQIRVRIPGGPYGSID